jgi:hypothetical protein
MAAAATNQLVLPLLLCQACPHVTYLHYYTFSGDGCLAVTVAASRHLDKPIQPVGAVHVVVRASRPCSTAVGHHQV